MGRFRTAAEAQQAAEALRSLARDHEQFMASPEGEAFVEEHACDGAAPPLVEFGDKFGFDWSQPDDGLWWEEEGYGAPILTAGAVGESVVVYHPYCMGLPEGPFKKFFANVGAVEFGYWQYGGPLVVADAAGENAEATQELCDFLARVADTEYASEAENPPWSDPCDDARLDEDEDRSTLLREKEYVLNVEDGRLNLELAFANTFAGACALESWLLAKGFRDVVITLRSAPDAEHLTESGVHIDSRLGVTPRPVPIEVRLAAAAPDEVARLLFESTRHQAKILNSLRQLPPVQQVLVCWKEWLRRSESVDCDDIGLDAVTSIGPMAAEWAEEIFDSMLRRQRPISSRDFQRLKPVFSREQLLRRAKQWLDSAVSPFDRAGRLWHLSTVADPVVITWVEEFWLTVADPPAITGNWGSLAAQSQVDWPTLRRWLERGRPLSLIAGDALLEYQRRPASLPANFLPPDAETFDRVLNAYADNDQSPRARSDARKLLSDPSRLIQR